ncbi:uncharacterized protein PGTG_19293 [Puccinia graminis f. sp. tritici CRL 75-36-700-3]|uniref:Uncharacterized protein n=1 Tax=Puccinia graminis f. sp. tritici (strain CRL 75-36-700-3 / race SCCL) TaxID=418459 RepID=E3L9W3_PUCGT|nr:uncharacterized protein PGTG_19293 [Puccinia graminis f. sp. tritici CRL 75-36-700-3]EFP93338.1 hypothetical protein PGTG_19293 [Puccinia graminis f. sp. tritici CRL 75-36-700-3]
MTSPSKSHSNTTLGSLIHSVEFIHESYAPARPSKSLIAVGMADRAKAQSITQAACGFSTDSMISSLCLVGKPELIAASAFLIAVTIFSPNLPSHIRTKMGIIKSHIALKMRRSTSIASLTSSRDGPEERSIQEPILPTRSSTNILNQFAMTFVSGRSSVRGSQGHPSCVGRWKRSRPSRLIQKQAHKLQTVAWPQGNQTSRVRPPSREEVPHRAVSSTRSRALMSANMDLGTPNESTSLSPKSARVLSLTGPTDKKSPAKKQSRSPQSSARPSNNAKLDRPSLAPSQPAPQPPFYTNRYLVIS